MRVSGRRGGAGAERERDEAPGESREGAEAAAAEATASTAADQATPEDLPSVPLDFPPLESSEAAAATEMEPVPQRESTAPAAQLGARAATPPPTRRVGSDAVDVPAAEGSIRVDIRLLDDLLDLAGELVLARNQLNQFSASLADTPLLKTIQRVSLITSELQEGVLQTRMQPMATIWRKFPRVIRDLAVACGKEVELTQEGEDTELDRSLLEAIKDPLTHLIRNAVDHGIESPEVREAKGKAKTGPRAAAGVSCRAGKSASRSSMTAAAFTSSAFGSRPRRGA